MPRQAKYTAIADHYREQITSGELQPAARIPSVEELIAHWGVARGTIGNALSALQVEGLVRVTPRGTFVADDHTLVLLGLDRLSRVRRSLPYLAEGEVAFVHAAELVVPPMYVGDLFGLDPDEKVLRREYTVGYRHSARNPVLVVDWYPAQAAVLAPELLETSNRHTSVELYLQRSGRVVRSARDDMEPREASVREAGRIGVRPGAAVIGHVSRWWDEEGVIVYCETVVPTNHVIGYQVEV